MCESKASIFKSSLNNSASEEGKEAKREHIKLLSLKRWSEAGGFRWGGVFQIIGPQEKIEKSRFINCATRFGGLVST